MFLGKIKMYLMIASGVVMAIAAAFLRGKSEGRHQAEYDAQSERLDSIKAAKEVEDEVESLDDAGLSERASKWVRKANRK